MLPTDAGQSSETNFFLAALNAFQDYPDQQQNSNIVIVVFSNDTGPRSRFPPVCGLQDHVRQTGEDGPWCTANLCASSRVHQAENPATASACSHTADANERPPGWSAWPLCSAALAETTKCTLYSTCILKCLEMGTECPVIMISAM